jgi:hypothetical protein
VGGSAFSGKLIGFAGKANAGKTTAAEVLVMLGYSRLSFAQPVKSLVRHLLFEYGFNISQIYFFERNKTAVIPDLGVTIRHLWQTIGTNWGRQCINPQLWVMMAERQVLRTQVETFSKPIVFDDVRYENEAQFIRDSGGIVVHIVRDTPDTDPHSSEAGIAVHDADFTINNNTGEDNFIALVKGFA